jgi:hypothetical protein
MDHPTSLPVLPTADAALLKNTIEASGAAIIAGAGCSFNDFVSLSEQLMTPMIHHATNTIERDPVSGDPSTSTVNKGMDAIPLHREGSYAPGCPDLLMFYCERPADNGGRTILCDGAALLESLPADIRAYVNDLDLVWTWEATPERWMQTLQARDRSEAQATLGRLGGVLKPYEKLDTHFEGETLHGRFITRCVIPSWGNGTMSFCNSLMIYTYREKSDYYARDNFRVTTSDGGDFPLNILDSIRESAYRVSTKVQWDPGNVVLIDNSRYMHGREGFDDRQRRVLIRMGYTLGQGS